MAGLRSSASSFRIVAGISSGPAAFTGFRFRKSLRTPGSETSRGVGWGWGWVGWGGGGGGWGWGSFVFC